MNNSIVLNGCIEEFKNENEFAENDSEIFELFCLTQGTKYLDITFDDLEDSIVDGSKDGGIDSVIIVVDDEYISSVNVADEIKFSSNTNLKISFAQTKTENSFKEATIDKLITSFPVLLDLEEDESKLSQRFNPLLVSKILVLRALWLKTVMKGGRIVININYFCKAN